MQLVINALLRFRNSILYLILLGISLLFLSNKSDFHQYKLEKYSLYLSGGIYNFFSDISDYFDLKKVNLRLSKENSTLKFLELKSQALPLYRDKIIEAGRFPFQLKSVKIIKNSFQNQRNYLILDQGSKNGIRPEMAVISSQGILGIVKSVSKHYSSIISILHLDLKINVRLKNKSAFGSLVWKGNDPKKFSLEDIILSSDIKVGDTLITGGMSSYFPLGIPVGQISKVETSSENGYFKISVELFKDPSQVNYAYVLENIDIEELKKLKLGISR